MRGYNRRFIGAPESVYVVTDTAQVIAALTEAVRQDKRVVVRGGGHCLENFVEDPAVQVVIDLSRLDDVRYDPLMGAFAVGGGATLGRVYTALDLGWGVTLPAGSCPAVGVGGHVPGGGNGVLSRLHGHASDHLYAVEVVVVGADGTARAVVATREPDDPNHDLWWAHTGGGGGNFGIVTRFWFRTPGADVTDPATLLPRRPSRFVLATAAWRWEDLDEQRFATLLDNFAGWCARNSAPDTAAAAVHGEVVAFRKEFGLVTLMGRLDPSEPGSRELLDAYLAEVSAGMPEPVARTLEDEPWLYKMINVPDPAATFGMQSSRLRSKLKAAYLRTGLDGTQLSAAYRHLTDPGYAHPAGAIVLASWGGRINAVAPADTATSQRDSTMLMSVVTAWDEAGEDERHLAWVRSFYRELFAATGGVPVRDERTDGSYINWPDGDLADPEWNTSGVPWSTLYYGDNYPRLREIKSRWDPRNVFRHALSVEGLASAGEDGATGQPVAGPRDTVA
ncbi:FAD-binding oxidoreductase [Actinoplanes teichomyceticus]|nr:FAD-binding protein [Actinoplanes teichomyceticus]